MQVAVVPNIMQFAHLIMPTFACSVRASAINVTMSRTTLLSLDFHALGAFHVLKELVHVLGCFFHANSRSTIFSQQL